MLVVYKVHPLDIYDVIISNAIIVQNLQEHDDCDKLILDLADSMARTLGYIEDVEQFARLYQLKRSIEEIRPLMEDTTNFILMFTNRSGTGMSHASQSPAFFHSPYIV